MVHHETTFFHRKLWTTKPDRIRIRRVRVPPERLPAMGVCCMSNLIEPQQTLVFFWPIQPYLVGGLEHEWIMTFHSVENFIIPTDSYFSEG